MNVYRSLILAVLLAQNGICAPFSARVKRDVQFNADASLFQSNDPPGTWFQAFPVGAPMVQGRQAYQGYQVPAALGGQAVQQQANSAQFIPYPSVQNAPQQAPVVQYQPAPAPAAQQPIQYQYVQPPQYPPAQAPVAQQPVQYQNAQYVQQPVAQSASSGQSGSVVQAQPYPQPSNQPQPGLIPYPNVNYAASAPIVEYLSDNNLQVVGGQYQPVQNGQNPNAQVVSAPPQQQQQQQQQHQQQSYQGSQLIPYPSVQYAASAPIVQYLGQDQAYQPVSNPQAAPAVVQQQPTNNNAPTAPASSGRGVKLIPIFPQVAPVPSSPTSSQQGRNRIIPVNTAGQSPPVSGISGGFYIVQFQPYNGTVLTNGK